jgi:hypothetical protein
MAARSATPFTATAAKVQFEGDKWMAAKLMPHVYGDRLAVDATSDVNINLTITTEQRRARLAELLGKVGPMIEGKAEGED